MPRGYRTPLHLNTVYGRLAELTRFLTWLTGQGVASLADIDEQHCAAYLSHRRYLRDGSGVVVGQRGPATRRAVAQVLLDLVNYRDLFTADRVRADLRPWGGATPTAIAEEPRRAGPNKTPPVSGHVLQPMLAAADYLVTVLGPQAVELAGQVKEADRRWSLRSGQFAAPKLLPSGQFALLLADYERRGEPLPLMSERALPRRLAGRLVTR
ncbi:hypothetical protein [Leekyejoonella antrihumi]|uniref:Uncharacterized protein n=1 Tax=Leekyejoonella antrihumi TaxID=1660198 RepID=A0A563DU14_9MICO|nr:hypothetical protein [Leekyejoonella antrihumi]TWP33184.1 hypothetical protein FGL98_22195 [Leekyejoonella antrihumi]